MHTDHTVGVRVDGTAYFEMEESPFLTEREAKDSAVEKAVGLYQDETDQTLDGIDPYDHAEIEHYTPPE